MKVSEVNQVLQSEKMQNKETNFKIVKPNKKLTIEKVHAELVEFKDIVLSFIQEQRKVNVQNEKNWEEQRKFNQFVLDRLDNLIKKNNLKE